jgi:hypothetical protein
MAELNSKDLRKTAKELINEARSTEQKYTAEQIKKSKHPNKICELCGQFGCDRKYAGQYLHNKCYRKITQITKKKYLKS